MRDREFADLAAYTYRKKLEAADKIGSGRVRIIDPDFGDQREVENLLEGFKLPVYQAPETGEVDPSMIGVDGAKANEMSEEGGGL